MRFADTSFWVGLQIARDSRHADAAAVWSENRQPVRTSTAVLGETWTLLNRRAGHRAAVAFVDAIEKSARVSVVGIDEETDRRAWTWLRARDERTYSYVDATSFELMRRDRLSEALAFDGDFSAAGFIEVRPEVG